MNDPVMLCNSPRQDKEFTLPSLVGKGFPQLQVQQLGKCSCEGWTSKKLRILDAEGEGQERYFNQEGLARCRFYGGEGNSAWDCDEEATSKSFGPVEIFQVPG
jgi:hypothetical protein